MEYSVFFTRISQNPNYPTRIIRVTRTPRVTYQPAYQLESTVFFSHNKTASADFNTSRISPKHISPNFFYTHELQKQGEVNILKVQSCNNVADLFTKSLPATTFRKCIHNIGIRRLRDLQSSGGDRP